MSDVVRAGTSVLLDINDGERFLFNRVVPAATVKLGNEKFDLQCLIGCPYGALFEVQNGPSGESLLARCSAADFAADGAGEDEENGASKDNRNLIDNNTAQGLSAENIADMKREGTSGRDIVNALIANSNSYQSKTAFSQEKYKRRKQKKYAPRIKVRKPTAMSVCEAYFSKSPFKIGCLRIDSLSLLLSLANVGAGSNVLVVDKVGGLVTAAVAERLSGFGSLCSIYFTSKLPSNEIVDLFNFNAETSSRLFRAPFSKLAELAAAIEQKKPEELKPEAEPQNSEVEADVASMELTMSTDNASASAHLGTSAEVKSESEHGPGTASSMEIETPTEAGQKSEKAEKASVKRGVQQASDEDISAWLKEGFSSLVVAAPNMDPSKLLQTLSPFLAPSAPFSVYHTYLQPLAECMHSLQVERIAVGLQLSEPWMREYQVLPARTHPHMQMSATGGYLLSGTRLSDEVL